MSISYIPDAVKLRLWGKAAGRCQYGGCNAPLWLDELTQFEFNAAYIAHIVADSPDGPRGHPEQSSRLRTDPSNLMLLCDKHHRLVDIADVGGHPRERLEAMKAEHERRIEITGGIQPARKTEVLLYGANIGAHASPVNYVAAAEAVMPDRFPADRRGIALGMKGSMLQDRDQSFWQVESDQLLRSFATQVTPRLAEGSLQHVSVFSVAPQPLLVRLGTLLSDLPDAEVFQLHREPRGWRWPETGEGPQFIVTEPTATRGPPALVLSISATVTDKRIVDVLGSDAAIWRISLATPNNDALRSREMLGAFRRTARTILDRIKAMHGEMALLHLFPAAPVSAAVEFGRVWMPKADLRLRLYDEQKQLGGFVHAMDIGEMPVGAAHA
ncbi:MAG: HNH endonuclease [Planctomycetes bacterium]|nr:HNH endonuclease [Planctomycetota bacterium]